MVSFDPYLSSAPLAEALHRLRPELPIILMTGYGGPIHTYWLKAAGIREVINKPLSSARLADSLSRHLSNLCGSHAREAASDKG